MTVALGRDEDKGLGLDGGKVLPIQLDIWELNRSTRIETDTLLSSANSWAGNNNRFSIDV